VCLIQKDIISKNKAFQYNVFEKIYLEKSACCPIAVAKTAATLFQNHLREAPALSFNLASSKSGENELQLCPFGI
jgi:hypothetical protein